METKDLPQSIIDVLDTYDDNKELYSECRRIQRTLETMGWTCNYDLSGGIYDVQPILNPDGGKVVVGVDVGSMVIEVATFVNEDMYAQFLPALKQFAENSGGVLVEEILPEYGV